MNEQTFVERREPDWQRLTHLCDRADSSPSHLSGAELRELVRLYRRASTDLAVARTRSTNVALIDFLNDLTARVYAILYRQPRKPILAALIALIGLSAQTVRRQKVFVLISFALFFGSAFGAFFVERAVPETRAYFIPAGSESNFEHWKTGKFEERTGSEGAMMTAFYASNNPRVSIIAGAVGAGSFGLISLYMLVQNGAIVGVLANELAPVGRIPYLLSSIAPHGVPELSGIIISGASGLLLGYALINPGRRTRGAALRSVGADAVVLLGTGVALTLIAAPIEGFFSFNPRVPGWAKVTVAVISLAGWLVFWTFYARTPEEQAASQPPA